MFRVLLYLVPLALAIYALVDLVQTKDEDIQGLPKLAWVVLIVLFWVVGPVAWLIAGKRGRSLLPGPQPRPAGGPAARRPVAPDDDPDFLRGLGRQAPPPRPADPDDDAPDDPPLTSR